MLRVKQVWLSFWCKDQGLGMVEIALMLPMFLMFAFAVMDFGNYMIVKNRIVSANTTIANAIRNNPTMSVSDLNTVINNTLGDLVNPHTSAWVKSFTTPPTIESVDLDSAGTWVRTRDIQSPWLADGDSANDNNTYYVGIRLMRGVPWLTPLPRMLSLDVLDPENRSGDAPYGRKIADSFSFVTLNSTITCPEGQFLSNRGGRAVCAQINAVCPDGQYLTGVTGTTPDCRQMEVRLGDRFRPTQRVLNEETGFWADSNQCDQTRTTETVCYRISVVPGNRNTGGGSRYYVYQNMNGEEITVPVYPGMVWPPDDIAGGCPPRDRPSAWFGVREIQVTRTRNMGRRQWSQYTNDSGQVWCTDASVTDPTEPIDECPDGSVQVGISPGGSAHEIWCKPFLGIQ